MSARGWMLGMLLLVAASRVTTPPDFEGDQAKQASYVMDLLHGGDWALQYEVNGQVSTKPPLYNWIAASLCLAFGTTAPWVIKLPSLLAGLALVFVLHRIARRLFDAETAFWTALVALATYHFVKLTWIARTDMLTTLLTYAAIAVTLSRAASGPKAVIVGVLLGANVLTKGPVGPALYLAWLILWTWNERLFTRRETYASAMVSAVIMFVIVGVWLVIVWNMPQFQDAVLGVELGNKLRGEAPQGRPMYYYVRELFSRTEPWPLVAFAAFWFARGKEEWRRARFCAIWWFVVVLLFTLMPDKRADRLLPAYPPMFMLAGLGIRNFLAQSRRAGWKWTIAALGTGFVALAAALSLRGQDLSGMAIALLVVLAAFGLLAIAGTRANSLRAAILASMTALIAAAALYDHGFGNTKDSDTYAEIRAFARAVENATSPGKVLVWKSDLLVSYELGLHQPGVNLPALAPGAFDWVVTTNEGAQEIARTTGWKLEPAEPTLPAVKRRPETRLYERL